MSRRVMIEDVGRLRAGQEYDYPLITWDGIADSLGRPLDEWSKPVGDAFNELLNLRERVGRLEEQVAQMTGAPKGRKVN